MTNKVYWVAFGCLSVFYFVADYSVGDPLNGFSGFAKLHVGAIFWVSFGCVLLFFPPDFGSKIVQWIVRVLAFLLGVFLFVASFGFNFLPLGIFPRNIFYSAGWLFPDWPIWVEILGSRFCFSFGFITLLIFAVIKRGNAYEKISEYLSCQRDVLYLAVPFGRCYYLDKNGDWHMKGRCGGGSSEGNNNSPPTNGSADDLSSTPKNTNSLNQQKPPHNTNFLSFHLRKNSTESGPHNSPMRVIGLLLQACRPLNMLMGALMVLLSCGFATSWQFEVFQGVLVCVSVGFLIGAQMLLNDVYDRKIDKEQKPWRPLASGQIHLRTAVLFSIFLTTFSCVLAAFVSLSCFIYVLILGCLCFFYSSYLKKQWGVLANVLSSGLTASLCFSGLVLGGRIVEMLSISLSVVCACMAREIAKDVEDLSGDRLFRQRTLPMLFSEKTVRNIVCLFVGLQILFSYLPLTLGTFGNFYFLLISVCNILFVASIVPVLRGTDQEAARQAQQIVKIFMVVYLCIFFIC